LKAVSSRWQHEHTPITHSHPEIPVMILLDRQHKIMREAAALPKNLRAIPVQAAQFAPASVPDAVAVGQNAVGRRPRCSLRPRNPAHGKLALAGLGGKLDKPRVCAQERMALSIGLDSLRPIDGLEDAGDLYKALATQPVEPEASPHQQRTVGSIAKGRLVGRGQPLRLPKCLKPLAVVAKDSVFRAHPDETRAILVDLPNRQVAEPFCISEGVKAIFLGAQSPTGQQQQRPRHQQRQEKGTRVGFTSHYQVKSANRRVSMSRMALLQVRKSSFSILLPEIRPQTLPVQ
jgi:hypothetical protein